MLVRHVPSSCVCLSVTSRCFTETAKRSITQLPRDASFWCRKSRQNSSGSPQAPTEAPNAGGVVKIGDVRQITRYNSKTSTVASVVNLIRSQVYHTERPPLFAARLPWCSASRGFISDSRYTYIHGMRPQGQNESKSPWNRAAEAIGIRSRPQILASRPISPWRLKVLGVTHQHGRRQWGGGADAHVPWSLLPAAPQWKRYVITQTSSRVGLSYVNVTSAVTSECKYSLLFRLVMPNVCSSLHGAMYRADVAKPTTGVSADRVRTNCPFMTSAKIFSVTWPACAASYHIKINENVFKHAERRQDFSARDR